MITRPTAWTPIEQRSVERHGQQTMLRVGVFQPAEVMAGTDFIIAWGPRTGTGGPGVCVAPHRKMPTPFPYCSDTKALSLDLDANHLFGLAPTWR